MMTLGGRWMMGGKVLFPEEKCVGERMGFGLRDRGVVNFLFVVIVLRNLGNGHGAFSLSERGSVN
jgi:hypothetical protein